MSHEHTHGAPARSDQSRDTGANGQENAMEPQAHWESIYETNEATEVSWFQQHAAVSLRLIKSTHVGKFSHVIDVGGGASTLVDDLLNAGYGNATVLDISGAALHRTQERLGSRAANVTWIVADITAAELPPQAYDVWHDRAVFHFLTDENARKTYVEAVERSVRPGGHVIVATFGPNGPLRCSGLPVVRYSPDSLQGQFGSRFELVDHTTEEHSTPFGTVQQFIYCHWRKALR
jgi:ubiquinone/menaquinone biosynthesis C-methylase UbiE